ncbi:hypothetical protein FHT82_001294 [Rhizobium sp. BK275]|nr:hypothetical protein [Rhizobium sp. BK275]
MRNIQVEESRLRMLLGSHAEMRDLLATQRRTSSGW